MENIDTKKKTVVRLLILLMCAMIIPVSLIAQDFKAGIKGGVNFSNFTSMENIEDQSSRTGFSIGAFAQIPILDGFALQPEIAFNTKGSVGEYNIAAFEGTARYNLNYIDVPLLAVFKLGQSAEIHVGPYIGLLLGNNIKTDVVSGELNADDNFKTLDYGLAGGFALNFSVISVGTRYNLGLNNVNDSNITDAVLSDVRNSLAQVYIALTLTND